MAGTWAAITLPTRFFRLSNCRFADVLEDITPHSRTERRDRTTAGTSNGPAQNGTSGALAVDKHAQRSGGMGNAIFLRLGSLVFSREDGIGDIAGKIPFQFTSS